MSYRELTETEKQVNRNRALQNFCHMLGPDMYLQFCHVSIQNKTNGKYAWMFPKERDQFMAFLVPEIAKFCGKYWDMGSNPDALPHPICIAMNWVDGRVVKDSILKVWPDKAKIVPMVRARCERLGIKLNVNEKEFEV